MHVIVTGIGGSRGGGARGHAPKAPENCTKLTYLFLTAASWRNDQRGGKQVLVTPPKTEKSSGLAHNFLKRAQINKKYFRKNRASREAKLSESPKLENSPDVKHHFSKGAQFSNIYIGAPRSPPGIGIYVTRGGPVPPTPRFL